MAIADGAARAFRAPVSIRPDHILDGFDCGKQPLDDWLKLRALDNEGKASRSFVVANHANEVLAYYTLAAGSVIRKEVPGRLRHNLPNPVPVMVLGRLAVHHDHAGRGLGPAMLREAMERTARASLEAGIRALVVHAIDDDAVGFYARYGFRIFPPGTRTMFLPIETVVAAIRG